MKTSYSKQHIDKTDIQEVIKCLKSNFITQGPLVGKFERNVAKYVGSKYAVAVSSCTAGLHLALKACDFGHNDKLLTSVISFVSSANVSQFLDGDVDFIDIDLDTISMNIKMLEKKIDNNVKAIIPVHIAGAAYNEKKIYKIAKKKNIPIIEDCAHSLGGKYEDGSMIGSCKYSDMSVFSLHPVKSITTGEGGIITTNNKKIYLKLLRLRSHGINKEDDKFLDKDQAYTNKKKNSWYYEMRELGYHYRLTDFQCALGISQLKKINLFIEKRRLIAKRYDKELNNIFGVNLSQLSKRNHTSSHLYILKINYKKFSTNRQELFKYLSDNDITVQVHYMPIVMHPYYKDKGFNIKDYPNAKKYYEECVSIPCYYDLTYKKQDQVIKLIKNFLIKKKINVLLFGGSGLLGTNIRNLSHSNFKIISYINKHDINSINSDKTKFKLNVKNLNKFLIEKNISIIINASGLTSLEQCEINKNEAINSNSKIVGIILNSIKNLDVKLVHISTDHIFNKSKGKIKETSKTTYKNQYAKTKIYAENKIKKSLTNNLIIRTNFFGKGQKNRNSYSDFIIKNLKKKFHIPIWKNIYFSPVNLNFLSKCIFDLININAHGIYNISCNEKITKFKFAVKIANLFKLDKKYLIPKKFNNNIEKINRPLNMSLDNKKLVSTFPKYRKELNLKNQINKKFL